MNHFHNVDCRKSVKNMKFSFWLASSVMALGIFLPDQANSEVVVPLSTNNVRLSVPLNHHRFQRFRRHSPTRYGRHRSHRIRLGRVYSPRRHDRHRSFRHHNRGRNTGSFGFFIRF